MFGAQNGRVNAGLPSAITIVRIGQWVPDAALDFKAHIYKKDSLLTNNIWW